MADSPMTNEANGRDNSGKFAKGNKGGPGNPYAKQVAAYRKAIHDAVKDSDIKEVIEAMLRDAKSGGKSAVPAARLVLEYTVGKPKESVELEAGGQPLVFNIVSAKRRKDEDDESE